MRHFAQKGSCNALRKYMNVKQTPPQSSMVQCV